METEQQQQQAAPIDHAQPAKTQHDIAEIHRDMMALIPIPPAWPHIRHQSGLFSYPDLPHFNVIRQATFRDGRFVCPFCTVDFASKEGIRYHLYNSCTKSPYPKAFFRCLMCGSELADRSSLRTHLARHVSDLRLEQRLSPRSASARELRKEEMCQRTRSMSRGNRLSPPVEHRIRKNQKRRRRTPMKWPLLTWSIRCSRWHRAFLHAVLTRTICHPPWAIRKCLYQSSNPISTKATRR